MKKDEVNGTCSMHERDEKCITNFSWNISRNTLLPPGYRLINYYYQLVGGGGISNLYCLL
jgi:hypothetical protein